MNIVGTIERGTTPTHTYTLPFDASFVSDLRISYAQNEKELVVKDLNDCTLEGKEISVKLSQEDTFKFDCSIMAQAQLRVLTQDEDALKSEMLDFIVGRCLNSEVLKCKSQ